MLLNELNLKALNISASSVLPVYVTLNIEGKELEFKITAFQTGFGSGKKSVISGFIKRANNNTTKLIENADIEKVRRVCASLCELTQRERTIERKSRAVKEQTEVEKLRASLAVARRLPKDWITIDAAAVWKAYKEAKYRDRQEHIKKVRQAEVTPILKQIEKAKLSDEARALLLASLQ